MRMRFYSHVGARPPDAPDAGAAMPRPELPSDGAEAPVPFEQQRHQLQMQLAAVRPSMESEERRRKLPLFRLQV